MRGACGNALGERLVIRLRLPIPGGLAHFFLELTNETDYRLHLLVTMEHGVQHDAFGQTLGLGFHHQHGVLGSGNDQIEIRFGELRQGGIQYVLAVDITDPRRADGTAEGHAGNRHRRRRADERGYVRIDFRVQRHHGGDDLHLLLEALRERGSQGPVDQAAGEGFLFGRTPFALEKTAGDLAGGVGFFLIIDRQREEPAIGIGVGVAYHGYQYDCVTEAGENGAGCLAGDFSRFEDQIVCAVADGLFDGCHGLPLECTLEAFSGVAAPGRRRIH